TIFLNIYGMQRDARYFEQPDSFIPERFSPESPLYQHKHAYLPFVSGPRVCIGNAFAMMEMRLLLATMAQRFSFTVAPGHTVQPVRMFTLRSKYGMKMVAHQRILARQLA
ncbi:MAG: cytochrome P450, partial [Armatimonadetes bacterium]|nr:cytochrome P450 [Anaerolineae bacterium]